MLRRKGFCCFRCGRWVMHPNWHTVEQCRRQQRWNAFVDSLSYAKLAAGFTTIVAIVLLWAGDPWMAAAMLAVAVFCVMVENSDA